MNFTVLPTASELANELAADGYTIDQETAQVLLDRVGSRQMAKGGPSARSQKLMKQLDPGMYVDAAKQKMELSEYLETLDPTEPGSRDAALGVDAFSRLVSQLRDNNGAPVRVFSGVGQPPAHSVGEFLAAGEDVGGVAQGSILFHELMRRAFVEGARIGTARFRDGQLFYASSSPLWEGLSPQYLTSPIAQQPRLQRPLLAEMLAIRSTVRADTFKFPQITNQAASSRMRRVAEGSDFPIVSLTVSHGTGYTYKFAVGIEITDEAARRSPIDWLRLHVARIGAQNENDKAQVCGEAAIGGATAESDISTLTGGTASQVNSEPLDDFLSLFEADGYMPSVCVGPRATTTKLKNADTGTANQSVFKGPQAVMQAPVPEELQHPPIYSRSWGSTGKLLYLDGSAAMGEATEAGSNKQETDRNIRNGTNLLTLQEVVGYYVVEASGIRLLDVEN